MGRRLNSFGYRLGIMHFWRFQNFLHFPIIGYNLLVTNLINQLIFSTFSFNGYKVLFTSTVSGYGSVTFDVKLISSYYLDFFKLASNKELLISFNNFIFNYFFFIFKLIINMKILILFKIKLFIFIRYIFNLNFFIFNASLFIYFLINYYLFNFFKVINNIFVCFKKFYLLKVGFIRNKKEIFSFYKLNLISKSVEFKLKNLVKKKELVINASCIYSVITYFNNHTIKNLKNNLKKFWAIKQNLKIFEIIYFSCLFSLSGLLTSFLLDNLSRKKKTHLKFLNFFFTLFESLYFQDLLYVSGIKIAIFGKIDAKMRKQKIFFFLGKINLTKLCSSVSFTQRNFETRFGVLGIRV